MTEEYEDLACEIEIVIEDMGFELTKVIKTQIKNLARFVVSVEGSKMQEGPDSEWSESLDEDDNFTDGDNNEEGLFDSYDTIEAEEDEDL